MVLVKNVYREDTGVSVVIVDNLIFDTGDANVKPSERDNKSISWIFSIRT